MRKIVTAALVAATLLLGGSPVDAKPKPKPKPSEASRCKAEYATLRGTNGERFKNPGQCRSYVARGGSFAPEVSPVDVFLSYQPAYEGGVTIVTIDVSGLVGETARLYEQMGGFVIDSDVYSSEFPLIQEWSCFVTGFIRVTDNQTGQSDTETFAPPPEACVGSGGEE
jgi:hypothetical protein